MGRASRAAGDSRCPTRLAPGFALRTAPTGPALLPASSQPAPGGTGHLVAGHCLSGWQSVSAAGAASVGTGTSLRWGGQALEPQAPGTELAAGPQAPGPCHTCSSWCSRAARSTGVPASAPRVGTRSAPGPWGGGGTDPLQRGLTPEGGPWGHPGGTQRGSPCPCTGCGCLPATGQPLGQRALGPGGPGECPRGPRRLPAVSPCFPPPPRPAEQLGRGSSGSGEPLSCSASRTCWLLLVSSMALAWAEMLSRVRSPVSRAGRGGWAWALPQAEVSILPRTV